MKEDNKDDMLLTGFFSEARATDIPDNEFSDKVMQRIESMDNKRLMLLSRLWTVVCSLLGIAFVVSSEANGYIRLRGVKDIFGFIVSHLASITKSEFNISQIPQFVYPIPLAIAIIFAVAAIKSTKKIYA